jgi:hypothetical protein
MGEETENDDNHSDSDVSYISLKNLESEKEEQLRAISPSTWSCCGEIICSCGNEDNDQPASPDSNSDYENEDEDDPRYLTQTYDLDLNEFNDTEHGKQNKSVKFTELQITYEETPYQKDTNQENENGWSQEYYQNQQITTWEDFPEDEPNDNWQLPNQERENENTIRTLAWEYSQEEIQTISANIIKERWTIANQPINKGKMRCYDQCDTKNHHLHRWCTICQIRDDTNTHQCRFGFQNDDNNREKVYPDMDPSALVNDVFWSEPEIVLDNDQQIHERVSNRMSKHFYPKDKKDTNKRTQNSQEKYNDGKRYKRSHSV